MTMLTVETYVQWRDRAVREIAEEYELTLAEARAETPPSMVSEGEWWRYVLHAVECGATVTTSLLRSLSDAQWRDLALTQRLRADDALRADWGRARAGWTAAERRAMTAHTVDPSLGPGCTRCAALPDDPGPCDPPEPYHPTEKETDR